MSTISLPQLLTHSRMQEFKRCPRKHLYKYEMGVRRQREAQPLRLGSAVHLGLEVLGIDRDAEKATVAATQGYEVLPIWCKSDDDVYEWRIECETVRVLTAMYAWYWNRDGIPDDLRVAEIIENEKVFELPIVNPETGAPSTGTRKAGKRDKIVLLGDGARCVMEHKTTGEPIDDPLSIYWLRLRIDDQISLYLMAANEQGHGCTDILYDVIHKPGLEPGRATPIEKRKFTKEGRLYANQRERDETPEEYGTRVQADIIERPDFYFRRRRIPRLESDINEFRQDLWNVHQSILAARANDRWYRNTGACAVMGRCEYLEVCHNGFDPNNLPDGFVRVENLHPELAGD